MSDTSGAKQQGYSYEPYGAVTLSPSSGGPANPWRYAGSYQDPTALYKMGDRYYMAGLMRFTQQDLLESPTDVRRLNRYAYVGDNPVNRTDPSGHSQAGPCARRPYGNYGYYDPSACATSQASQSAKPSEVIGGVSASCAAVTIGGGIAGQPEIAGPAGLCSSVTGIVSFGLSLFGQ